MGTKNNGPKVLLIDIETAPMLNFCWGIWDQNVALNQIKSDWYVLSWSAKWLGQPAVLYKDQRNAKDIENDKELLKGIWKLLDEADIVVSQNGKAFDSKKLNARFVINGFKPPSPYRHIDTLILAKKHFAFTSNKLEYMSDKMCTKYKKLKHNKFPGFEMWRECLKGNKEAWREMERYNKYDVLTLEELYHKLQPWDTTINFNVYTNDLSTKCNCGGKNLRKKGYAYTNTAKLQRFVCNDCGAQITGKVNLLQKDKKQALKNIR
jgi:hypothetical protein